MTITSKPVRLNRRGEPAPVIVQILPALIRGGVERGTVEMTEAIVKHGGKGCGHIKRRANGASGAACRRRASHIGCELQKPAALAVDPTAAEGHFAG